MRYSKELTNKFYQYFTGRMGLKDSTKGFYRGDCPFCGSGYTFGVNVEKGKANCFRCAEGQTTMADVVMFRENLKTYKDLMDFMKLVDDYGFFFNRTEKKVGPVESLELPPHYQLISMGDGPFGKSARFYMTKKRGLRLKTLARAGVGYCNEGPYEGYIIIPYYVMGKLVYYTGRKFIGAGPKFMNPEEETYGVGKSQVLYNQDALLMYDRVHLVESAINGLTLGNNAAAFGGKDVSPTQLYALLRSPCSAYTIILDPDAQAKSYELAFKLCDYKRVKVIHMPEDQDVNSYGKSATLELIRDTPYMNHQQLRKAYQTVR